MQSMLLNTVNEIMEQGQIRYGQISRFCAFLRQANTKTYAPPKIILEAYLGSL